MAKIPYFSGDICPICGVLMIYTLTDGENLITCHECGMTHETAMPWENVERAYQAFAKNIKG